MNMEHTVHLFDVCKAVLYTYFTLIVFRTKGVGGLHISGARTSELSVQFTVLSRHNNRGGSIVKNRVKGGGQGNPLRYLLIEQYKGYDLRFIFINRKGL